MNGTVLGVIIGLGVATGGLFGLLCLFGKVAGLGWLGYWRDLIGR
jgi:hypothetical protein